MSKAVRAHEKWLDSIADCEPTHDITDEVKTFVAEVIERRTENDNEEVVKSEMYEEVLEEYPNIDELALDWYLGEVI
jgi:ATP sulfurylase